MFVDGEKLAKIAEPLPISIVTLDRVIRRDLSNAHVPVLASGIGKLIMENKTDRDKLQIWLGENSELLDIGSIFEIKAEPLHRFWVKLVGYWFGRQFDDYFPWPIVALVIRPLNTTVQKKIRR